MSLVRANEWLGFGRRRASVGITVSTEAIVVAALRARPLRLVALGRAPTPPAAVVNDEVRAVEPVAERLMAMLDRLGIDRKAPAVVTIDPLVERREIGWASGGSDTVECPVSSWTLSQSTALIERAGLRHARIDLIPAAALRLAELLDPGGSGMTMAGRWLVARAAHERWVEPVRPRPETIGLGLGAMDGAARSGPPDRLVVPRPLRHRLELDHDGLAIGAALAGLGFGPDLDLRPTADTSVDEWLTQPVDHGAPCSQRERNGLDH